MTKSRHFIVWISALVLGAIIIVSLTHTAPQALPAENTAEDTIEVVPTTEPTVPLLHVPVRASRIQYEKVYTNAAVSEKIAEVEQAQGDVQNAIDSGRYTPVACEQMVIELNRLKGIYNKYLEDQTKYIKWEDEYHVAAYVWSALKADGYSDAVCAGILGNMMAECGGHTLVLDYTAYNSREHGGGLCGWLYRYYPEANGASLEEQVNILLSTIEEQIDYSYSFEQFTKTTDVSTAALTFAKHYERCNSMSYTVRQRSAQKAYAYFVLGEQH